MFIAGVDNGLDGGITIIKDGTLFSSMPMPTINTVKSKREYDLTKIKNFIAGVDHVFVEQAQAMPGQGVSSMFTIGKNYGLMMGILSGLGYPFTVIAPQTWQKQLFSGFPKASTKSVSVMVCQRLWPNADWRASERCKVAHDGMTDSACIAEYGRRVLTNGLVRTVSVSAVKKALPVEVEVKKPLLVKPTSKKASPGKWLYDL